MFVREASAHERRSLQAVLTAWPPDLCHVVEYERMAIGFSGMKFTQSAEGGRAWFWISVLPRWQWRGAGTLLLENVVAEAKKRGVSHLVAGLPVAGGSASAQFLERRAFRVARRMQHWEGDAVSGLELYRRIYDRLVRHGHVPAGSAVIPLAEAPAEEVRHLVVDGLRFPSAGVAARLQVGERGYSQTLSRVALREGQVVGVALVTSQKTFVTIEARVVAEAHRNSWVNIALLKSVGEAQIARGILLTRFQCDPMRHRETEKSALRAGSRLVQDQLHYECTL